MSCLAFRHLVYRYLRPYDRMHGTFIEGNEVGRSRMLERRSTVEKLGAQPSMPSTQDVSTLIATAGATA